MMHRTIILLLVTGFLAGGAARGQGTKPYSSRLLVKPSAGYYFPTTKLLSGAITDDLIEYGDRTFYWQVLSATWFFHQHWGVEFNFQAASSPHINGRIDRFAQAVHSEYGDRYFVTTSTGADFEEKTPMLASVQRGFLGAVYRLERERLLVYPKVAVGITSLYTDWGRVYLKEKNTNNVYDVFYWTGSHANDFLTGAASGTVAYKLGRRVYLSIDLQATYYKARFTYSKLFRDLANGTTETEYIPYREDMLNVGVGGGVIIVLK